jgi:putative transposase
MRWTSDFFHDRDDDCGNRCTDEMDKRFFFMTETTIAEIAVRPFFCSAAPRAILPSRPSISQPPRAGAVKAGRICGHRKAWP